MEMSCSTFKRICGPAMHSQASISRKISKQTATWTQHEEQEGKLREARYFADLACGLDTKCSLFGGRRG